MLCLLSEASKQPVSILPGVGPVRERQLADLDLHTLEDLVFHLPHRYEDWRPACLDDGLPEGRFALRGAVSSIREHGRRPPQTVLEIDCPPRRARVVFFGRRWLQRRLSPGQQVTVYGEWRVDPKGVLHSSGAQIDWSDAPSIVPVYPASADLKTPRIRGFVAGALDRVMPGLGPVIPGGFRSRYGLLPLPDALESVHRPREMADGERGKMSLAFLESLLFHLAVGLSRRLRRGLPGRAHNCKPGPSARLLESLPFTLTGAQRSAIAEVGEDMALGRPAHRLIQGDVGSGKTVVAVWASVRAVECGGQAVWLVPTRLLAEQHYQTLRRHLSRLGMSVSLVTAESGGDESADVVVGTHSVINRRFPRFSLSSSVSGCVNGRPCSWASAVRRASAHGDADPSTLAGALFGGVDLTTLDEKPRVARGF